MRDDPLGNFYENHVKWIERTLIGVSLVVLACCSLFAQDGSEKINSNLGVGVSLPLNPTSNYVHVGWGATGGVGYNFNTHHSLIGEFMWNRLYASDRALQPIRAATQMQSISGASNVYALTGNYRFELHGNKFGTYFLGGGGLYYRTTNLSKPVASGVGTACAPAWIWWGFSCTSGLVTANQQIASAGSTAFGLNVGVGATARVGEEPYRLYVESRYHYAPTENISTQIVMLSFGIRY